MAGSILGNIFKISTWGESHGKGVGVVVDGCPAGLPLNEEDIQICLNRRRPGQSPYSTPRQEADQVQILSGVFEGKTTGTPISLVVYNQDHRSADYSQIASYYRPGHADFSYDAKYGFRDYKGSGRASGRETTARVAAGAIAKKLLETLGIIINAYTYAIGPVTIDLNHFNYNEVFNNFLCMPDATSIDKATSYLETLKADGNSSGGIIDCVVRNLPAGIGDPVFEKLDANLAKAVMSIGSVKGVEIGDGFEVARRTGIENNDPYTVNKNKIIKKTNHAGGMIGGISDGSDVFIRAAVKPTPSIHKTQQTVNKSLDSIDINIEGRHDPIIVPRAVVVVESMVSLTVVDALLMNMSAKMDNVLKVYKS